ncbi:MAG: hypothetical protein ABL997_05040 [Planctomycetota bacterium]
MMTVSACSVGLATVVVLAACGAARVGTTPFSGPPPTAVLVVPPRSIGAPDSIDVRGLSFGADRALQTRGYRSLPLGAGFDLWNRFGASRKDEPEAEVLRRLQHQAGIDAVLVLEVSDWRVDQDNRLRSADWDITWRVLSAATGDEVWRHRLQGHWTRTQEPPTQARAWTEEPPPVEIGGTRAESFANERDLIAALHRSALLRLPEMTR